MRIAEAIRGVLRRSRSMVCGQRPAKGWPEYREFRCGLPRGHDGVCEYYRTEER